VHYVKNLSNTLTTKTIAEQVRTFAGYVAMPTPSSWVTQSGSDSTLLDRQKRRHDNETCHSVEEQIFPFRCDWIDNDWRQRM